MRIWPRRTPGSAVQLGERNALVDEPAETEVERAIRCQVFEALQAAAG